LVDWTAQLQTLQGPFRDWQYSLTEKVPFGLALEPQRSGQVGKGEGTLARLRLIPRLWMVKLEC